LCLRGHANIRFVTSQGHPLAIFQRALELLNLIALNEPALYDRAARRWLVRLVEERQELTVVDVQLAAGALAALTTASHDGALAVLRSLGRTG
jgi:hypothetical protein